MRDILKTATAHYAEVVGSGLDSVAGVGSALRRLHQSELLGRVQAPRGMRGRCEVLSEVGALDLSLARLLEGHLDARGILDEAGQLPSPHPLYGVWAAEAKDANVVAELDGPRWRLHGAKRYCSGAAALDRALVTARAHDGVRLFDVDLRAPGVSIVPGTWPAVGMASSGSSEVRFDLDVPHTSTVGPPGFYLQRPGFWQGSVGVAACWYGGSVGCARMLAARFASASPDEHALGHLGAVLADCHAMNVLLERASLEIDLHRAEDSPDPDGRLRALLVRQTVEQGCQRVLTATGRASGSAPLAFDAAHARRAADLVVYLRQHHAERDLAALGRLTLGAPS